MSERTDAAIAALHQALRDLARETARSPADPKHWPPCGGDLFHWDGWGQAEWLVGNLEHRGCACGACTRYAGNRGNDKTRKCSGPAGWTHARKALRTSQPRPRFGYDSLAALKEAVGE